MNDKRLTIRAFLKETDVILGQIILFVIVVVIGVQVIQRFVFSAPFDWPEELSEILLIWLTFIGAVALTRRNDHIRVELIEEFGGPRLKSCLNIFFDTLTVVFLALMVIYGWDLVNDLTFEKTPALRLRISTIIAIVPITAAIMIVYYMIAITRNLINLTRGGGDGD
jgi:TRAP-type C4-dicarboxylate transport system permease small subunit